MGEKSSGSHGEVGSGFSWEQSSDLTVLSVEELKSLLERLSEEEREISYRRRVLQGRIDLIRAEIVRRGGATVSPEELARILLDEPGEGTEEERGGS